MSKRDIVAGLIGIVLFFLFIMYTAWVFDTGYKEGEKITPAHEIEGECGVNMSCIEINLN